MGFEPMYTGATNQPLNHSGNCHAEAPGADPGPMDFQSIAMTASAKPP